MSRAAPDLSTGCGRSASAFPAVTERLSHGTPTFFVRDKKTFVYAWVGGHHDNEFPHLWCAAAGRRRRRS